MANNYTQIKALVDAGNKMGLSNTITRDYGMPLDISEIYDSFEAAKKYAGESPVAYVGQIIAVITNTDAEAYIISPQVQEDGTYLKPLASLVQPEEPEEPATPIAYSQAATLILSNENMTISNGEICEGSGLSLAAFDTIDVFTDDRTLVDVLNDIKRGKILCLGGQLFYEIEGDGKYACVINNLVQDGSTIKLSGSWYKENASGTYDCFLIGLGNGDGDITIAAQENGAATFEDLKTPPRPQIITITEPGDINLQKYVPSTEVTDGSGDTKKVFSLEADLTINIETNGSCILGNTNDEIDLGGHTLTIVGTGVDTSSIDNIILTEGCTGDIFFKDISVGQNVDLNEEE
jgi:hypothetical protein